MGLLKAILMAISLCADCFAVSLCSGVTIKELKLRKVLKIAFIFAFVQTALLTLGWLFGYLLSGVLMKISHIVGFLLLLYVGGGMLREGIKNEGETKDLNGFKNVILGGIATSIDALAVGASMSITGTDFRGVSPLLASVYVVTLLSVVAGLYGGRAVGARFGRWAEIVGGVVLIGIGVSLLF